jgi:hypothetical protein
LQSIGYNRLFYILTSIAPPKFPRDPHIPDKIQIQDRYFPSILRIGQKLKPQTEINTDLFVGKVLVLHGEADDEGKMQGEVTLILFLDEQQIKAKVLFAADFYSIACDAHKKNQYIRILGVLSEKPRYSDLKDVSKFEIIQ